MINNNIMEWRNGFIVFRVFTFIVAWSAATVRHVVNSRTSQMTSPVNTQHPSDFDTWRRRWWRLVDLHFRFRKSRECSRWKPEANFVINDGERRTRLIHASGLHCVEQQLEWCYSSRRIRFQTNNLFALPNANCLTCTLHHSENFVRPRRQRHWP